MIKEVIVVSPRGFCAGVARSIKVVEDCLEIFGAPIYVKHAIVHNKTVVSDLEKKGVITVEHVSDIPEGSVAVFSAHGSPPEHYEEAVRRNIRVIDATCPLVAKVHMEIKQYIRDGYKIIYIGHKGHVEGLGVIGEALQYGVDVPIIESVADAEQIFCEPNEKIACLTQTTLSVDETSEIIETLRNRCAQIVEPPAKDICYATTNRQKAIRHVSHMVDLMMIVGSQTSSNSNRLREVAEQNGCHAYLIDSVEEIQPDWLEDVEHVGISAGASAPEYKVQEIIDHFVQGGAIIKHVSTTKENMVFTEPIELMKARQSNESA
jgi:4-hydroxy-3-methylbut-2-enyl diphosphate reductase